VIWLTKHSDLLFVWSEPLAFHTNKPLATSCVDDWQPLREVSHEDPIQKKLGIRDGLSIRSVNVDLEIPEARFG